ncbi:MAG TPA: GntP family permease, partial [Clostridia bacterium]|nr:GntP family permease [Clostridia bacterium]
AAFAALKDTFVSMGISLDHVHRVAVIASGTLDTLPHQGAQITLLNICGMTHKEAYFDIAVTQIIIPFIALGVVIPIMSMGVF